MTEKKLTEKHHYLLFILIAALSCQSGSIKKNDNKIVEGKSIEKENEILPGAERPEKYLHLIAGKNTGLVVNQTSVGLNQIHLVDFLIAKGVDIQAVFAPGHGFRGDVEAGGHVGNYTDEKTGISVISLYGKNYKPKQNDLIGIDVMIFDVQDVGARFYTYISTMHYVMEACAEADIPLIILDRPNPNGDYIDGPVLNLKYQSFVGMHPIPVVHGMTIGELALMINGEGWLNDAVQCDLRIIKAKNYDHTRQYSLPVKPSPNLPNDISIQWYPSLCLFEATKMSIGRGTDFPFQVIGYPDKRYGTFSFTPHGIPGVAENPKHKNKTCWGTDLRNVEPKNTLMLSYLIKFYRESDFKDDFFNTRWLQLLSGTDRLERQIKNGWSEAEIKKSWQDGLVTFQNKRKKYLLYPDFTKSN